MRSLKGSCPWRRTRWLATLGLSAAFFAVLTASTISIAAQESTPETDLVAQLEQRHGTARLEILLLLMASALEAPDHQEAERWGLEARTWLEHTSDPHQEIEWALMMSQTYGFQRQVERAMEHARLAVRLARELDDPSSHGRALLRLGNAQRYGGDLPAALDSYGEARTLLESTGEHRVELGDVLNNSGVTHRILSNHLEAMEYFLLALEAFERAGATDGVAFAALNVGNQYTLQGQLDEAESALNRALEVAIELEEKLLEGDCRADLGSLYLERGEPSKAKASLEKALVAYATPLRKDRQAAVYNDLGRSHLALGDSERALEMYRKALDLASETESRGAEILALGCLSMLYREKGDTESAIRFAVEGVELARRSGEVENLQSLLRELEASYANAQRFAEAYRALKEYEYLREESLGEESRRSLAEMQARFEAGEREREIELLKSEQALQAARLRNQRTVRTGLLASLAGLVIIFGLIFNRYRLHANQEQMRRVNTQLREVDRLKDEFLAKTSHELRTPLYGIVGLADSLLDGAAGEPSSTMSRNLSMIAASGRRLGHLVNDILDFSKLRHRSLDIDRKPVDLRAIVDIVLTISSPLIAAKDLRLDNAVPPDLPPVLADENRLQQILHNLVGNAIKFTEAGKVSVHALRHNDDLVIRVEDSGVGISEDDLERIFNAFEQAEVAIERTQGGTGLGLAVTRRLIELHGGSIWVESKEGEGSVFFFTMPIAKDRVDDAPSEDIPLATLGAQALDTENLDAESLDTASLDTASLDTASLDTEALDEVEPEADCTEGDRYRILAVDDEVVNRQVLMNFLAREPVHLTTASDGQEALRRLEEQTFDLILLDVMMPHLSGFEVCRQIRLQHPIEKLPILFLTAKNQLADRLTGFELGANDFLSKPISKDELLARIKPHLRLLDSHRHLEEEVAARISQIKVLEGILSICAACKRIRDEEEKWQPMESYIDDHSEAQFSHGLCPDCLAESRNQAGLA